MKREVQMVPSNSEELIARMLAAVRADGTVEVFPGFRLSRASHPTEPVRSVYQPSFCFVAQGSKRVLLGEQVFKYDPEHYLIYTVDLPLTFQVEKASEDRPYLGFQLDLEPTLVASVIMESGICFKKGDASAKAMNVSSVDADLLDAVVRLVRLAETPTQQKVLAPLIIKEIVYRLLIGGQGARLSHILGSSGDTRRISKAIGHLRKHFDEQLKMDEIARELGMSVSGFHHHFKSVTSMSPLQFQKHLRLQEARRLMLGEDLDAASAGFRVGYQDPSHFSREYKRHFGAPPQGDISSLRSRLEV
ncbi:MAG TPA: AraC family transcriptional regulator [Pyrinomonadaceae bacterium]|nr:AraC family transcriptional regulator [Pyrinomonadaceae bacterium]